MLWPLAPSEIIAGAAQLLALALAPPLFSPQPPPSSSPALSAILAALVLVALAAAAVRLSRRLGGRAGLLTGGLLLAAVLAALAGAAVFRGDRAPLGRGLLYVAAPLWAGLALAASLVAGRRSPGLRARVAAGGGVLVLGAALLATSARWLGSPARMWMVAVQRDENNAVAVEALTRTALYARDFPAALRALDGCPEACACLAQRAEIEVRTGGRQLALAHARTAADRCPEDPGVRAALVVTMTLFGDAPAAEQEARTALQRADAGRLHYALAIALDAQARRDEALEEVRRAVALGSGRDAALLLGALLINAGDLDGAARALGPLAADPNDGEAQYDLALVADRMGDYNRARSGYLAALRADPMNADARFNLALLTLQKGVVAEAGHHAARFAEAHPDDPRNAELARRLAGLRR